MKKQVALALAAAFSLSVAGTALAAPANPFVDVPANHWAYDAISALQKDGVVDGYGDGTFRGDRTLTRYEMAAMIAKITYADGKHESLIKRLQSEFANELYNLGVRVDALEKGASTIKFTGDARIRYQQGNSSVLKEDSSKNTSRFQERIRLNLQADVNDSVKFIGRLKWENTSNRVNEARANDPVTSGKESSNGSVFFDRAEFAWTNGSFGLSAGRLLPTLGQGLIWNDERADGFLAKYNNGKLNFATGYLDFADAVTPGTSLNAYVAHLGYDFTDKFGMTAAYWDGTAPTTNGVGANVGINDGIKLWSVGAKGKLGKDFTLLAEYVKNSDAPNDTQVQKDREDDSIWARLKYKNADMKKPGSYHIQADYLRLGGYASFSGGSPFDFTPAGYGAHSTVTNEGTKGWGLGTRYVVAKNVNVQADYYYLKPINNDAGDKYRPYWALVTNFVF